jgi:hypothetical protein
LSFAAKTLPRGLTYAQNLCCGATHTAGRPQQRCKNNSAAKSLISLGFENCIFGGQRSQALDFSDAAGLRRPAINKVIHTNWG